MQEKILVFLIVTPRCAECSSTKLCSTHKFEQAKKESDLAWALQTLFQPQISAKN